MEDTNQFLRKATDLFIDNGAKTLTMDDIAREFGISKKTLYQKYKNKEALLEDVLEYKLNDIITKMQELDLQVDNAIERMYCKDHYLDKAVKTNNSVLIKQLIKYYPAIFNSHMINFADKFADVLIRNIQRGRLQGVYRTDFDETVFSKLFLLLMMSCESSPILDQEKNDRDELQQEALKLYMNAITTEKGKEILKKINN